jgi:predicted secreted Zn-dependent protease
VTRALVALLVIASASAPALADRNDFAIDYFTVDGETSGALSADIDAKGPVGENGRRSDGYTRWSMSWTFGMSADDTGCAVSRATVDLGIRMTLPRWNTPPGASPQLIARWNRYIAALRNHEDGHRSRAETAADELRRAFFRERAADCALLEKRLDALANALLAALRERQAAYDRETQFGQKQGVRRP